jgi:hypothetical protein
LINIYEGELKTRIFAPLFGTISDSVPVLWAGGGDWEEE